MTVTYSTNKVSFNADGTTVSFDFAFKYFESSDIHVLVVDTDSVAVEQTEGVDYVITSTDVSIGGTVTFNTAPAASYVVFIYRYLDVDQETVFNRNTRFPETAIEDAYDKLTMIAQQLEEQNDRTLKLTQETTLDEVILVPEASKLLRWNTDASGIENVDYDVAHAHSDLVALEYSQGGKIGTVYSFGAVGDGVTDDTVAVQAAIDALDVVIFPSGTFLLGQIEITATQKNIIFGVANILHGAGADPLLKCEDCFFLKTEGGVFSRNTTSDIGYYLSMDNCVNSVISNIYVDDTVAGWEVAENEQILGAIYAINFYANIINNPRILTFGKGVYFVYPSGQNVIRDGVISSFNGPDVHLHGSWSDKILNTDSEGSKYAAPSVDYGTPCHVLMTKSGTTPPAQNIVSGCYLDGKGKHAAVVITDGVRNVVENCHLHDNDSSGSKILLDGASTNNVIRGNRFSGDGFAVLEDGTADFNIIDRNNIVDGTGYSISTGTQVITPTSFSEQVTFTSGISIPSATGRIEDAARVFRFGGGSPDLEWQFRVDSASPTSLYYGSPPDIYLRTSGGAGTTLYVKESGADTTTGWVGK